MSVPFMTSLVHFAGHMVCPCGSEEGRRMWLARRNWAWRAHDYAAKMLPERLRVSSEMQEAPSLAG